MRRLVSVVALIAALFLFAGPAHGVTKNTTRFIASFEGFSSCVYADPAGHATIGYGHLIHYGPPTRRDRKRLGCLTRARALRLLQRDILAFERDVVARIGGAKVTPGMITALTSFAFNLGAGALDRQRHSGTGKVVNIAVQIRKGNYRRAARQMLLFNGAYINGKRYVLKGLVIRRRKEARLIIRDIGKAGPVGCQANCPGGVGVGGTGGLTVR